MNVESVFMPLSVPILLIMTGDAVSFLVQQRWDRGETGRGSGMRNKEERKGVHGGVLGRGWCQTKTRAMKWFL